MQILYVHGKGGSAGESKHYKPLFPDDEVIGLDYHTFSPWETGQEIRSAVNELARTHEDICLIANSIGAFFSMNAGIDGLIRKAYFIYTEEQMAFLDDWIRREKTECLYNAQRPCRPR